VASKPHVGWLPKMIYPLVAQLAAGGVAVTLTCRVLNIARQPYYRWLTSPVSERDLSQAHLVSALHGADRADPEFGYRFLGDEVRAAGFTVSDRTVWKHASRHQLWSVFGKKRGKNGKAGPPVFDDRVDRIFRSAAPNRVWLTDITEHTTREGKLYVCAVNDVFSNRIVGYSIGERMQSTLAVSALNSAVARRGNVAGCIVHSDPGSQFRSRKFAHA